MTQDEIDAYLAGLSDADLRECLRVAADDLVHAAESEPQGASL